MVKVNELAKELKEKGIASNFEDAYKLAEKFLQKEVVPDHSKKMETTADKYEIMLERVQRKFHNDVEPLKEQMKLMANEIMFLKEEIKRLKIAKPVVEQPKVIEKPKISEIKEDAQSTLAKEERKEPSQRTGILKPGDVNISDYFYFGNKKKD